MYDLGFSLFKKKKLDSVEQSVAPKLADLPPIPEPSITPNESLDVNTLPVKDSDLDELSSSLEDDELASETSSIDTNSSSVQDSSINDLSSNPTLSGQNEFSETTSNYDEDVKEQSLNSSDVQEPVEESMTNSSSNSDVQSPTLENNSADFDSENSKPDLENDIKEKELPKADDSSLPTFDKVDGLAQVDIDIESFSISDLYVKKEVFATILDSVEKTKLELEGLLKKSSLSKTEKESDLVLKASKTHASLNKDLIFVEKHFVK